MSQAEIQKDLLQDKLLLKQGAEAKLYSGVLFGRPTIAKERFSKSYRHPVLDRTLTVRRTRAEVKCIQRCRANGILCPAIYYVDMDNSVIYMEHLKDSIMVKDYIMERAVGGVDSCMDVLLRLAIAIGQVVGTMHRNHIIHGDLTTSNLLLVGKPDDCRIAVIDFGLASIEETAEDKGVDLYVLERALLSTHPSTEPLFEAILRSYKETYSSGSSKGNRGGAAADEVLKKLDEIRLRGRKRTMVG